MAKKVNANEFMLLYNCPFCGGTAERVYLRKHWSRVLGIWRPVYIRCKTCAATSPVTMAAESAREAWNRRETRSWARGMRLVNPKEVLERYNWYVDVMENEPASALAKALNEATDYNDQP